MITDPATSTVAPSPAMPSTPLTPRECEILSWLRMGKSNWAIGQILGISEHTVKHMVSNILRKYGVLSRYHLMHLPA